MTLRLLCTFLAILLVTIVEAKPVNYGEATILKYDATNDGLGTYSFEFDTSDGTHRDEKGELKEAGTEDEALVVHGSYSYMGADGVMYAVKYMADENGFHPEGDHIKVPDYVPWVKGQPHDDGHYHPEPSGTQKSTGSVVPILPAVGEPEESGSRILSPIQSPSPTPTYIPSSSSGVNEVSIQPKTKYIPALKKRDILMSDKAKGFQKVDVGDINQLL